MSKRLKRSLKRIIFGIVIVGSIMIAGLMHFEMINKGIIGTGITASFILYMLTYLVVGGDVIIRAIKNIYNGQMMDENFLMVLATVGAIFVGDYKEAVAVMLFYQVGEFFQEYAVTGARKSIKDLMEICPDTANVIRDGEIVDVEPDEVMVGETIIVRPGERIPLDGVVTKGTTNLDTKALTGESMPRTVGRDDAVISGCINLDSVIEIRITKKLEESTVTKILELVENAQCNKGKSEQFITKFARVYTPLVVAGAIVLAFGVPLIGHFAGIFGSLNYALFKTYIYRALTFLVISCPCALVISIPLSFFGGIGGAGKKGILIKGSNYLENLVNASYVFMDKTGTVTEGSFKVTKIESLDSNYDSRRIIDIMAALEANSNHPIAVSLKNESGNTDIVVEDSRERAGNGVSGMIAGHVYHTGNADMMRGKGILVPDTDEDGTICYLFDDEKCYGYCIINDCLKSEAKAAVAGLKKMGVKKVVMLTGDRQKTAENVAVQVGMDEVHYELLPADKMAVVDECRQHKQERESIVFVGDGINDAPVLAGADIGIAMGGLGQDAAIEAADIVIMDDNIMKIPTAMRIARKTLMIVKENIVFAITVKILVLLFATLGLAGMWWAVFADVGVAVLAILNAMRALRIRDDYSVA